MGARGERIRTAALVGLGLVLVLGACKPLRDYPAAQSLFLGTAARATAVSGDPTYATNLGREFNGLVPENELKWDTIHPQQNTYNFAPADTLVQFAKSKNMAVRGVPLLWDNQNPAWLTSGTFRTATLRDILAQHIATVVGRYRNDIVQWDVVNEPFDTAGQLKSTFWKRRLGTSYMDDAFRLARAADADAKLFLNDWGLEVPGPKADAVFTAVRSMRQRGIPIDGIGFEMHVDATSPTAAQVASQMARYAAIGVEVAITELDVRIELPITPQKLTDQATKYRELLAACRAATNCRTFVMWGFSDKYSWVPAAYPGFGAATIMDSLFAFKPAYVQLNDELDGP